MLGGETNQMFCPHESGDDSRFQDLRDADYNFLIFSSTVGVEIHSDIRALNEYGGESVE
jgi:hypothetical protein